MTERLKRVGKAQHSYIKEKRVKGVSFLCTYTLAETVSHLNILEKAISERKEKKRKENCRGHQIVNWKMNWRSTYKGL
jgi:propanediol dehydratase large subunit